MSEKFDLNKIKQKLEEMSHEELKELALKTLVAREKNRLRNKKYYNTNVKEKRKNEIQ